jgi:hypothetical protein
MRPCSSRPTTPAAEVPPRRHDVGEPAGPPPEHPSGRAVGVEGLDRPRDLPTVVDRCTAAGVPCRCQVPHATVRPQHGPSVDVADHGTVIVEGPGEAHGLRLPGEQIRHGTSGPPKWMCQVRSGDVTQPDDLIAGVDLLGPAVRTAERAEVGPHAVVPHHRADDRPVGRDDVAEHRAALADVDGVAVLAFGCRQERVSAVLPEERRRSSGDQGFEVTDDLVAVVDRGRPHGVLGIGQVPQVTGGPEEPGTIDRGARTDHVALVVESVAEPRLCTHRREVVRPQPDPGVRHALRVVAGPHHLAAAVHREGSRLAAQTRQRDHRCRCRDGRGCSNRSGPRGDEHGGDSGHQSTSEDRHFALLSWHLLERASVFLPVAQVRAQSPGSPGTTGARLRSERPRLPLRQTAASIYALPGRSREREQCFVDRRHRAQ